MIILINAHEEFWYEWKIYFSFFKTVDKVPGGIPNFSVISFFLKIF